MKWFLLLLVVILIVMHQDIWNWASADPRLFGFLPVGLWYQGLFTILCSLVLGLFVKWAWPKELEEFENEP